MGKRKDLMLRLVEQDLQEEQLAGASINTLKGLRASRHGGPTRIPKKRIQRAIAQDWQCHWCQQQCREDVGWQNSVTLDHVVPRSQGCGNEPGTRFGRPDLLVNVRISCVDTDTGDARVTDADRPMWLSQIAQGL